MANFFLESPAKEANVAKEQKVFYRLYAVIDDLYYWKAEWTHDPLAQESTVRDITAGFISDEILALCRALEDIDAATLRERFGGFASFVERAVNSFKSYVIWISPDSQTKTIPWKITRG